MKLTNSHKNEFFEKGWTVLDMGFNKEELEYFYEGLLSLKEKALEDNYPLGRVYYPHLRSLNISAIEAPFNQRIINQVIKEFFIKLRLGKCIKELMGWKSIYLSLARLFTMSSYRYRGDWHRDFKDWEFTNKKNKFLQCAIYLKDQPGFRLFNKEYEKNSKNVSSIKETPPSNIIPLKIDNKFFTEIPGKAGTVLFFDPGLLHQGNCSTSRLDFHFRFTNEEIKLKDFKGKNIPFIKEDFLDFEVLKIYSQSANTADDNLSPRIAKSSFYRRLLNSINYYTITITTLKILFLFITNRKNLPKYPWKFDITSNSFFQKG